MDAIRHTIDVRKKIGVVLQQPSYEPTLSVEKSLEKYGMMWNVERKMRKDRAEELLSAFDLQEIRNMKNDDLSIGQRRRVQVAREFMHDMDLLFLDEPTVGSSRNKRSMSCMNSRATCTLDRKSTRLNSSHRCISYA